MVFFLVGLGLGDPRDVTVRGLAAIRGSARVYLEAYTSILSCGKEALEEFYGREVVLADREQVEQASDELFAGADAGDVALLVVGDPLGATTHTDLKLRAHQLGITVEVVSNASILNAVGCTGLQLYHFGETVSIPFWQDGWEPVSFLDKINRNQAKKLHTLCLLDIKVKEQSLENLLRGRKIFEPPRYMRVHQAAQQLLAILHRRDEETRKAREESKDAGEKDTGGEGLSVGFETACVGVVRVGTDKQRVVRGTLKELAESDLGEPLHSLIVCGELHPLEEEALARLSTSAGQEEGQDEGQGGPNTRGTFHLIGLGLGQPEDVTVKGLEVIKGAKRVFLEGYTSVMQGGVEAMQELFGREVEVADREKVEQGSGEMLDATAEGDVAFLVVGDPFGATTHTDLVLRAMERGIRVNVVHNASIMNAVGCCGLQLYSFGETVSIPFWDEGWQPESFYDKICSNLQNGWHTLCLLDIKVKEQSVENLVKGRKIYEPPRFMTVAQAASQLVQIIARRKASGDVTDGAALGLDSLVIGVARVGTSSQQLKACTLEEMAGVELGGPLHSLVVVGETHPMEDEYVDMFR